MNAGAKLVRQIFTAQRAGSNTNIPPNTNIPNLKLKSNNRRRKRGTPVVGLVSGPSSSGSVRVRDTEKASFDKASAVVATSFPFNLKRLGEFSKMYERYQIHTVRIRVLGTAGSAQAGTIAYGVLSGGVEDVIKTADDILALRPSRTHHVSQQSSIVLGHDIQLSKYMRTDDKSAFTLYSWATVANVAFLEVSYDVTFSSPRPF